MSIAGFDWDDGNVEKCRKHGLSIAEIETAFRSETLRVRPDVAHSQIETRFQAVGRTGTGRHVFLVIHVARRTARADPADQRPLHAST